MNPFGLLNHSSSSIPKETKFKFDPVSRSLTAKASRRPLLLKPAPAPKWMLPDMDVQLGNRRKGLYDKFQLIPRGQEETDSDLESYATEDSQEYYDIHNDVYTT